MTFTYKYNAFPSTSALIKARRLLSATCIREEHTPFVGFTFHMNGYIIKLVGN